MIIINQKEIALRPIGREIQTFYAKKKIKIGFVGAGNYSNFLESLKSIEGVEVDSILSKTARILQNY